MTKSKRIQYSVAGLHFTIGIVVALFRTFRDVLWVSVGVVVYNSYVDIPLYISPSVAIVCATALLWYYMILCTRNV